MGERTARFACLLLAPLIILIAYLPAAAEITYVKANASGKNDGSSWGDAYTDLQSALIPAVSGDSIWVAAGTYTPTLVDDRAATFQLANGVAIYGGFAGTEVTLGERDWEANVTILSGDIGVQGESTDNSYHVVTGSDTDGSAVLDGFTVTSGVADGTGIEAKGAGMLNESADPAVVNVTFAGNHANNGAGMSNHGSSPTLVNVTFAGNHANSGAGMFNFESSPTLVNVTFSDNHANSGGGGITNGAQSNPVLAGVTFSENSGGLYGGGIHNKSSAPQLSNVIFSGNDAVEGGGMWNSNSSPSLVNVVFSANSATYGGGMWSSGGDPTLTAVAFNDNYAVSQGGGMLSESDSSPTLFSVTFSGNHADYNAGGMYNENSSPSLTNVTFSGNWATYQDGGGMYNLFNSTPTLVNVVFWENTARMGGGMWNFGGSPKLTNVTFCSNGATADGGGMWNYDNSPVLTNTILWNDWAGSWGQEIENTSSMPLLSYSLVQGSGGSGGAWDTSVGIDGGHNIDADPLFVIVPGGNLRLSSGYSPAVNAGSNAALPPGIVNDLDGNPRIVGQVVDLGAYEFQVVTGVEPDRTPHAFRIVSISPNPFNPSTTVHFMLPAAMWVTAEVWSAIGTRVRVLASKQQFGPGDSRLIWDGRNDHDSPVASGVYFIRIQTRLGTSIGRAVLLK